MKCVSWTGRFSVALVVVGALGCGSAGPGESVDTVGSPVLGVDTFMYFRSNATGWQAEDATRLRSTANPYVFDLTYDVGQDWMVTNGDNAFFTETNQFNGWGSVQTFYGSSNNLLIVPGRASLQTTSPNAFVVRYPRLGKYRVNVNTLQGTFGIDEAARAWEPLQSETPALTTVGVWAQSNDMMVAGYTNGDIFLTFNARSSTPIWTKIDASTMPALAVNTLAIDPRDNMTMYAAFAGRVQGHKVWKTVNGGQFWQELPNAPQVEIRNITVNPVNHLKLYCIPESGVAVSDDGGTTWTSTVTADPLAPPLATGDRISTVAVINNRLDNVWVGTITGQIWMTFNASAAPPSQSWTRVDRQVPPPGAPAMPARLVTRLTPNPRNLEPPAVWATFAGLLNDSVWLTSNGGQFWVNRHNPDLPTTPIPVSSLAIYGVSVNPIDDNVVYANEFGTNRSVDRGLHWTHQSN